MGEGGGVKKGIGWSEMQVQKFRRRKTTSCLFSSNGLERKALPSLKVFKGNFFCLFLCESSFSFANFLCVYFLS